VTDLRVPAESAPHERTVMCWPTRRELWGDLLADAETAYAEVARAITRFEPVTMIAAPGNRERASQRCGDAVEIVEIPIDDSWFRDSGPIYALRDDGSRIALDFTFNGWGEKFLPYADDARVAARWARHAGHERREIDFVLEGGAVTLDGAGTILTTEQCLLHPNRNPKLTRSDIEAVLCAELGGTTVVWLPYGLADDDDTDGHVDNVAAFVGPGRMLVQGCDDPDEPDHVRLDVDRRCVEGTLDANGQPISAVEVPVLPFADVGGERCPVPYLNLYLGNGFALVPVCGHPADDDMLAIVADELPGREIVGLDVGAVLAYGGGGIHCITQQVPVGSDRSETEASP
jgi:agmatine deiminase